MSEANTGIDVQSLRQELVAGSQHLAETYLNTNVARSYLQGRTKLVDGVLKQLWQHYDLSTTATLIAVGGYGRGELYPYSDIDILILLKHKPKTAEQDKISQFITVLWDLGLEIGQSVRSLEACIEEADNDISVQTNMLEARHIVGSQSRFNDFLAAITARVDITHFFKAKEFEQRRRHQRFENTPYSLEPNSKESPGGLRDLQLILWLSNAARLGKNWRDLVRHKLITSHEARELREIERFLQHVRIRLHLLANRHEDRLLFEHQHPMAEQFFCQARPGKHASEAFMQKYYINAKKITQLNTIFLLNFAEQFIRHEPPHIERIDDIFELENNLVKIIDGEKFKTDSSNLLRAFRCLQINPEIKGFTAATRRLLWQNRILIDQNFRQNPRNKQLFLDVFRANEGIVTAVRALNQFGMLSRYLPAWELILCQMQHDLFHVYTVDEHSLMVLRNLRRFTMPELAHEYPLMSRLMERFKDYWQLYLAAIFHDIAKGRGGDHSKLGTVDAALFCREHELEEEARALIPWLVEHHLMMSSIAQKSDIHDPEVIAKFAAIVGNEHRLDALYLLTHADIRGTSPKVWNSWKARLLEDLFHNTRRQLQASGSVQSQGLGTRREEVRQRLRFFGLRADAEKTFWDQLDQVYFMRHSTDEIAWHTRLLYRRSSLRELFVKSRLIEEASALQLLVYTPDEKDLFRRVCYQLSKLGLSVLDARIHTTKSGMALDTFTVHAAETEEINYRDLASLVEHSIFEVLSREMNLPNPSVPRFSRKVRHFASAPKVAFHPDESGKRYILSVSAIDRPYLLFDIADTLNKQEVQLHSAKITTLGERAEDTFELSGQSLQQDKYLLQLTEALEEVLAIYS